MRGMEAILCHTAQAIWCVVQLAGARHAQSSSAGQRGLVDGSPITAAGLEARNARGTQRDIMFSIQCSVEGRLIVEFST